MTQESILEAAVVPAITITTAKEKKVVTEVHL